LNIRQYIGFALIFFSVYWDVKALTGEQDFSLGLSQDHVLRYPFRFNLFDNCNSFLNPATAGCHSVYELAFGNQRMFGAINHVSASYFTFHLRLQPEVQNRPFSSIGIILYNDREGKYLNRSRFYVSYAWHASLSHKVMFSAGLNVGGMNYSVKGTPLSGDGSDTKADGAVGVSLYSNTFHAEVSVGQIFNSKVQPLEEVTVLSPMVNMGARKSFAFDENLLLEPSFSIRLPFQRASENDIGPLFDLSIQSVWRDKLLLSSGLHNNSMIFIASGINNISISTGRFGLMIAYAFPAFHKSVLKTRIGEAGINYYF
jgi:hypothetical protein